MGKFRIIQPKLDVNREKVVELYANSGYVLQIDLRRLNKTRQKNSKAYTPYFAKPN